MYTTRDIEELRGLEIQTATILERMNRDVCIGATMIIITTNGEKMAIQWGENPPPIDEVLEYEQ